MNRLSVVFSILIMTSIGCLSFHIPAHLADEAFLEEFRAHLGACTWEPHKLYSVFTQYDKESYLVNKEKYLKKYQSLYAIAKTIKPKKIIELGTSAGSSADAYISGSGAAYLGIDTFGIGYDVDDKPWDPYKIANKLFKARKFTNYRLLNINLRALAMLPELADMVVVDAAHDFDNEYQDLKLALTAKPRFILVDDINGKECALAVKKFINHDVKGSVESLAIIEYEGNGLIIKLKDSGAPRSHKKHTKSPKKAVPQREL